MKRFQDQLPTSDIMADDDRSVEARIVGSDLPVLVDYWAEWCEPCQTVFPIVKKLASEYEGKLLVARVNADSDPIFASSHDVVTLPTQILFAAGVEVGRVSGVVSLPKLALELEFLIAPHVPGD